MLSMIPIKPRFIARRLYERIYFAGSISIIHTYFTYASGIYRWCWKTQFSKNVNVHNASIIITNWNIFRIAMSWFTVHVSYCCNTTFFCWHEFPNLKTFFIKHCIRNTIFNHRKCEKNLKICSVVEHWGSLDVSNTVVNENAVINKFPRLFLPFATKLLRLVRLINASNLVNAAKDLSFLTFIIRDLQI